MKKVQSEILKVLSMFDKLREITYEANMELYRNNLIKCTWGNVSVVSRQDKVFAIKPSGVSYEELKKSDIVICDYDGNVVEGNLKPSSDTMTHAILYQNYNEIGSIVHTHSTYATAFAQAGIDIEIYGTTHADTFNGSIPCARFLTDGEISGDYEKETGNVIVETFASRNIDVLSVPAIILKGHGPFIWGMDAESAVKNTIILEEVCSINYKTLQLNPNVKLLPQRIINKHYSRKHGENAYYGQGELLNENKK